MGSGQKMTFTVSQIWVDAGMKVQGQPWPRIVQVQKVSESHLCLWGLCLLIHVMRIGFFWSNAVKASWHSGKKYISQHQSHKQGLRCREFHKHRETVKLAVSFDARISTSGAIGVIQATASLPSKEKWAAGCDTRSKATTLTPQLKIECIFSTHHYVSCHGNNGKGQVQPKE